MDPLKYFTGYCWPQTTQPIHGSDFVTVTDTTRVYYQAHADDRGFRYIALERHWLECEGDPWQSEQCVVEVWLNGYADFDGVRQLSLGSDEMAGASLSYVDFDKLQGVCQALKSLELQYCDAYEMSNKYPEG